MLTTYHTTEHKQAILNTERKGYKDGCICCLFIFLLLFKKPLDGMSVFVVFYITNKFLTGNYILSLLYFITASVFRCKPQPMLSFNVFFNISGTIQPKEDKSIVITPWTEITRRHTNI